MWAPPAPAKLDRRRRRLQRISGASRPRRRRAVAQASPRLVARGDGRAPARRRRTDAQPSDRHREVASVQSKKAVSGEVAMSCEKYKAALIDSAVTGAEPTPELRSHVAACTSCAADPSRTALAHRRHRRQPPSPNERPRPRRNAPAFRSPNRAANTSPLPQPPLALRNRRTSRICRHNILRRVPPANTQIKPSRHNTRANFAIDHRPPARNNDGNSPTRNSARNPKTPRTTRQVHRSSRARSHRPPRRTHRPRAFHRRLAPRGRHGSRSRKTTPRTSRTKHRAGRDARYPDRIPDGIADSRHRHEHLHEQQQIRTIEFI